VEVVTYTLTSLTITIGLFIGLILAIISPEELKPGKKYFKITEHILFYLIIFFSLTFLYINKVYLLTTMAILVFYFLEFKLKPQFTYLLLSILFYLSTTNEDAFLIISSLLFIYTIFVSINFRIKHIHKNNWKITKLLLINYIWFFIGTIILYFTI
tara:strand:- start:29946 stop:30413 length:468 start_codon:yes stop_codon:yes gene_type:complete